MPTCCQNLSNIFNVLPLTQSKHFVSVSQCLSAERTCRKGCQIEATIRLGGTKQKSPGHLIRALRSAQFFQASAELVVGVEPWVVSHLCRKCLSHGLQDSNQQPILFNTSLLKKMPALNTSRPPPKCIGDYHCHGEYCNSINI